MRPDNTFTFEDELIDSRTYRAVFRRIMAPSTQNSVTHDPDIDSGSMTQRTVEGPAVISPSTLPDVQTYSRFGRRDSDVITMSTVSTGSMSSTTSISTRETSVREVKPASELVSKGQASRANKRPLYGCR